MVEIAREQRPKHAPQAAFCEAREASSSSTADQAARAPICGGLNLFCPDVEIFLSPVPGSKVNTLGVNCSVLLIHPEDFTSSDGKTTLETVTAREPPNLQYRDNFREFFRHEPPNWLNLGQKRKAGLRISQFAQSFSITLALQSNETFRHHAGV